MLTFSCSLANGHIMLNTPVLVRSLKLSNIEPSQYLLVLVWVTAWELWVLLASTLFGLTPLIALI